MKSVAVLGSTGSIGTQTLDVIASHPGRFRAVALAAGNNTDLLLQQARALRPRLVSCARAEDVRVLADGLPPGVGIACGQEGLERVACFDDADVVVAATDGMVALDAVMRALRRGATVALANKELVVAAGELLFEAARAGGARILPVDSEHSAIFQCMVGEPAERIAAVVLTASGGPFWRLGKEEMRRASLADALRHPTWRMGMKNTIDSATMMNKGLEAIEASRFFGVGADRIRVLVHPASIAHGLVVFSDGSVKAQLAPPDMRIPIGYALSFPDRLPGAAAEDLLVALGAAAGASSFELAFERPDEDRFPCLGLAFGALRAGGTGPAALSAANEVAVDAFIAGRIEFGEIADVVAEALARTPPAELTPAGLRLADRQARDAAEAAAVTRSRPGLAPTP